MKSKTVKPPASWAAARNGGAHAPSTSANGKSSSRAAAVVGPSVKPVKPLVPRRPGRLWKLRLYVAGHTPKSLTAFANLKRICETHLKGRYEIEVVDLVAQPQLSKGDQILAIPTLVRRLPQPLRRILGDLSDTKRVLVGLDLTSAD